MRLPVPYDRRARDAGFRRGRFKTLDGRRQGVVPELLDQQLGALRPFRAHHNRTGPRGTRVRQAESAQSRVTAQVLGGLLVDLVAEILKYLRAKTHMCSAGLVE